jgi:hypothetical protein
VAEDTPEHVAVMSIKLLAMELYRARQNVERIAAQLEALPVNAPDGAASDLGEELRQAQAELRLLRKMLDDKKAAPSPSGHSGFPRNR